MKLYLVEFLRKDGKPYKKRRFANLFGEILVWRSRKVADQDAKGLEWSVENCRVLEVFVPDPKGAE